MARGTEQEGKEDDEDYDDVTGGEVRAGAVGAAGVANRRPPPSSGTTVRGGGAPTTTTTTTADASPHRRILRTYVWCTGGVALVGGRGRKRGLDRSENASASTRRRSVSERHSEATDTVFCSLLNRRLKETRFVSQHTPTHTKQYCIPSTRHTILSFQVGTADSTLDW